MRYASSCTAERSGGEMSGAVAEIPTDFVHRYFDAYCSSSHGIHSLEASNRP